MTLDVLLVEDDQTVIVMLQALVEEHGLRAGTAGTVAEAKDILEGTYTKVCIIDYHLPDGKGVELGPYLNGSKVYFLSGEHPDEVTSLAKAYGVEPDGVLHKPFTLEELDKILETINSPGTSTDK